jgi:hypothetical protein
MQISVIGAHLPRLDPEGLAQWIHDDIAAFKRTLLEMRASGASNVTELQIETRAAELPEELEYDLLRAAMFEVEVRGNTGPFDGYSFMEVNTETVCCDAVFLSINGESVLTEQPDVPSEVNDFRVVFYIRDWPEDGTLDSPIGILRLPQFTPVPSRLWQLSRYSLLD